MHTILVGLVLSWKEDKGETLTHLGGCYWGAEKYLSNIPGVKVVLANTLCVYDILNCNSFVIAKGAVEKLEEVYA